MSIRNHYAERNQRLFATESPVALVTGSASERVGRRIAEKFLNAGFRVAFHSHGGIQSVRLHEYITSLVSGGADCMLVDGAVEEEVNVDRWLTQILSKWERVDVLVNSAAIWEPSPLERITAQDLRRHWEVNCLGSFLTARRFGLQMTDQAFGGVIINIGDWAVARPYVDFAAYFLSKGCIETLTRTLAVELGNLNPRVRVNAVLPGPVMLAEGVSNAAEQRIVNDSLVKRAGSPDDVAEAVHYLAMNSFVTGASLPVDGGRSIFAGPSHDVIAHPKYSQIESSKRDGPS